MIKKSISKEHLWLQCPWNQNSVAQQNQWIVHFHSQGQCQILQQLDEFAKKLGWIGKIKEMGFQVKAKCNNCLNMNVLQAEFLKLRTLFRVW